MGYLVCKKCGGYYELQQGESPEDFTDKCECGGKLKYAENLDNVAEEPESQKDVKMCSRCGAQNDSASKFCSGCGLNLKSTEYNIKAENRKKFTKTTGGKVVIIIAALAILFFVLLLPYILVVGGYFFLVHEPYQNGLSSVKQEKLSEVNAYFKGPLATDPVGINLKSQVESATTPSEVQAIDVLTPATQEWRTYQLQQINIYKGSSGTVGVTYTAAGSQRNAVMKVTDAQRLVTGLDATVLSSMVITTP